MRTDVSLSERYPPKLRAPLVEWASRSGPAARPPREVVTDHLKGVLDEASRTGRRRGIWIGLLAGWLPAALVVLVAVAGPLLVTVLAR